jgi:Na+-driven multidrug efflux pump
MSTTYLLIAALGYSGIQISMYMSQLLNVIGKPLPVLIINLSRVFLFIMPLAYVGSRIFGFTGLVAGLAIANLMSGALAFFISRANLYRPGHFTGIPDPESSAGDF